MNVSRSENAILKKIRMIAVATPLGSVRLGAGDDAALFRPRSGCETILTSDWFLEGSHFLRKKHPPEAVGWKCLARAASDVAAMGGTPRCFLLSLALPPDATGNWLTGFLSGLRKASTALGCALAGGDTTRHSKILISVTVIGEVRKGLAVLRSGARPGDLLYVTGRLGEAELGVKILREARGMSGAKNSALRKHLYPEPRIAVGQWLANKKLTSAMMDLSDGLSTDLARLCAASGVGAKVYGERLPVTSLVGRGAALHFALHGGDDYELLFVVRPENAGKIPSTYRGVTLTRIGEIVPGKKITLAHGEKTRELVADGWDPFRKT